MQFLRQLAKNNQSDPEGGTNGIAKSAPAPQSSVGQLHEMIGNQGVGRLVRTKLRVSNPNDVEEREADRVANEVMRTFDHPTRDSSPAGSPPFDLQPGFVTGKAREVLRQPVPDEKEEDEEDTIQTASEAGQRPDMTANVQAHIDSLQGGGEPLPASARAFFEPRFGLDFSDVRVHTDSRASRAANSVNALAFTRGRDIVFAEGRYSLESSSGRRLLAHELTHTFQAGAGVVRRSAISDDIQAIWDATPTVEALLARLSRADVQGARTDADIDTKIATLLAGRAADLWVAQRIRQGRLGTTAGARPVEAHFIQGTTNRRALVIAGVHGNERQGIEVARMVFADLATNQPVYTVILVPSLFPDNAATATREGTTPTNRNFPPSSEDLAAATTAGGGTAVDASTNASGARTRAILPENIMLLQLIERFSPERIISIHGTRHSGAGGVFYDPLRLTSADIARARNDARAMAYMQVPVEQHSTFEGQELLRQAEERNFQSAIVSMSHRDRPAALAAAARIDAATTAITGREQQRTMLREGETTISAAELARRRAHPSVPGNVGPSGNLEIGSFSGSVPGGVSLGDYASQRGISIFTVEPPLNLRSRDFPTSQADQADRVDRAERRIELQAYADAVRTVLLGT
jgi:uncharacterized protein DUF4157/succinylglutamate desuccinylase/aspartoacylase family protein